MNKKLNYSMKFPVKHSREIHVHETPTWLVRLIRERESEGDWRELRGNNPTP